VSPATVFRSIAPEGKRMSKPENMNLVQITLMGKTYSVYAEREVAAEMALRFQEKNSHVRLVHMLEQQLQDAKKSIESSEPVVMVHDVKIPWSPDTWYFHGQVVVHAGKEYIYWHPYGHQSGAEIDLTRFRELVFDSKAA
jgi:hypothetical protein